LLALGLTVALFAFFSLVGYAVLRGLKVRLDPLQEVLLAPVVGVVVLTVAVYLINRVGVPVGKFAYPLTVVLLVAAGLPMVVRPRRVPWRQWRPFGLVLLAALLLVGWPMFQYGFDWLSLCNDDMANYCLGAVRFHDYPFFQAPTVEQLIDGRDYSLYYWFLHVAMMVRPGAELLLAWLMAVTQITPLKGFMPLILSLHLCQVSALGALVHQSPRMRKAALAACTLLALSALASFGALYQLVAQVIGVALIAGTAAVLLRPMVEDEDPHPSPLPEYRERGKEGNPSQPVAAAPIFSPSSSSPPSPWRLGILVGLLGAGLLLIYPEVIPIVGASWMLFLLLEAARRRVKLPALGTFVGAAVVVAAILLGRTGLGIEGFQFGQAAGGSAGAPSQTILFPYYQIPSGIADFWGFFPLTFVPQEPIASSAIAAGMALLLLAVVAAAYFAWRRVPVAVVCTVMLALTAFLAVRQAQFGLYKIAMFLQPFVAGVVALAVCRWVKWPKARVVLLALLAAPGVFVQQSYVNGSRGTGAAGGFPEVADPSRSRINEDFRKLLAAVPGTPGRRDLFCDTANIVLSKFQAYYTRGEPTAYPATPVGVFMLNATRHHLLAHEAIVDQAERLREQTLVYMRKYRFDLKEPDHPEAVNPFEYAELGPLLSRGSTTSPASSGDLTLLQAGPKQTILNRWNVWRRMGIEASEVNFLASPLKQARNHLMFVESDLGRSYFAAQTDISMFQLEPDPTFYYGTTMAGVGRRFVFQVVNPSPGVRLVLELTTSLNADENNALPPGAAAIGTKRELFAVSGRGSARVFSPALEPQVMGGRSFVGIDLGRDPVRFNEKRRGLMRLYGLDVPLDRRRLVCFGRDISAISERQYAALKPPSRLEKFPADLQNQELEYSGFYEDGWVSDGAWCMLSRPADADAVVVKGYVPDLAEGFETEVTVKVGGQEVGRKKLGVGQFEVRCPIAGSTTGRQRVDVSFSKLQNLTEPDGRPVGALLTSIGYTSPPRPPTELKNFPADFHNNPLLSPSGLYPDGWAGPKTSVRLSQMPGNGYLVVRGQVPKIGEADFSAIVRVRVDGNPVGERELKPGAFDLELPVPAGRGVAQHVVELEFTTTQQLPAGDGRVVGAQLTSIGFGPDPQPPERIERLPQDLKKPMVKADGVSDDGWLAQAASFQLTQPAEAESLTIAGMVPKIGTDEGFTTDLVISIDGQEAARKSIALGRFEIDVPVPPSPDPVTRRVELKFSKVQSLPPPDGRSVGAQLISAAFHSSGR
jgi:hypothetical protein